VGHIKQEITVKYNRVNAELIKKYLCIFKNKRRKDKRKHKINYDKLLLEETKTPQTANDKSWGELDENNSNFSCSFSLLTFFNLINKGQKNLTSVTYIILDNNKGENIYIGENIYLGHSKYGERGGVSLD